MWSVFLFVRKRFLYVVLMAWGASLVMPCYAVDGRAPFASLLAGGLSPIGLGGYNSSPARYADPSYGVSYYWLDDVDETSWNLSLEFGNEAYRVGAFVAYLSEDSLYRNLYSEASFAKTWPRFALGMSYGLDMEWIPGDDFWVRHRFKWALAYNWHKIHLVGMLDGFTDEGVEPTLGVHWFSGESISAFAECDFDYLYVGASFHWKLMKICTSYRFPDFAVALQISFGVAHYGVSYARGFKHNSVGWNGVHITRWLRDGRRIIN